MRSRCAYRVLNEMSLCHWLLNKEANCTIFASFIPIFILISTYGVFVLHTFTVTKYINLC